MTNRDKKIQRELIDAFLTLFEHQDLDGRLVRSQETGRETPNVLRLDVLEDGRIHTYLVTVHHLSTVGPHSAKVTDLVCPSCRKSVHALCENTANCACASQGHNPR